MNSCCKLCYQKYLYKNKKVNKNVLIELCDKYQIDINKDNLETIHSIQNPPSIKYITNLFTGGYKNEKELIDKTYCNCSCHVEGSSVLH